MLLVISTSAGDVTRAGDDAAPRLCLSQHIRGRTIPVPVYFTRNVGGDAWFQVGPFDLHAPVSIEAGRCPEPVGPVVTASADD